MRRAISMLTVCIAATQTAPVAAQEFPTRTIRAIAATSAGGTSDIFMRALGEELQKRWGHGLVVENRPGGNTIIGGRACAEAPKDGHTLCILPGEVLAFNKVMYKNLPYDAERDYEPIMGLFFSISAIVVNSNLGVKTLDGLAAYAKARPKTLAYMAPSVPLAQFMESFNRRYGTDLVRVPFRGGGETANAILSGVVPIAFLGLSNFVAQIQAGTMTPIVVDSVQRSPVVPNTPTLLELGSPDNPTRAFFGLVAPAGTPKPIVRKLRDTIAEIMAIPAFRNRHMIDRGLEPIGDTPEAFARFLAAYREGAARVVKDAGIEPQ